MFASLDGKSLIELDEVERIRNERRDLLKTAKQIGRLDKERSEQMGEITNLKICIESLNPWISLDVPL
ncbi:V-type ATP synthase subunit I, partial [[Ruminococcus] torques]|nr:V-type ATP synthase subunit I [[Ruminococcus] torques]